MFGSKPHAEKGAIWSLEGDLYIARTYGPDGEMLEQQRLPCLKQARDWLEERGAESIAFHPSNTYLEMCGDDQ